MRWLVNFKLIVLALAVLFINVTALQTDASSMERFTPNTTQAVPKVLSRQKRYLAFPAGSSLSAAICMTIGVIGNPNVNWLSWAVNWGVAYDLPNHKWVLQHAHGFANLTKAIVQRRSRRSLYEQVQSALERMSFNGEACVARSLCESSKYLHGMPHRKRGNMLEELLRTMLSFPLEKVAAHEPEEHHYYDDIFRRSKLEVRDCTISYDGCPFSLLELALGSYAATPAQFSAYKYM